MEEEFVVIRRRAAGRRGRPRLVPAGADPGEAVSLSVDVLSGTHDLAALQDDPSVEAAAPSLPLRLIAPVATRAATRPAPAATTPGGVAWGIRAVGADTSPLDGSGIVVAVLDTGIKRDHPAFASIPELIVRDFTGEGAEDYDGHGTHCAGTIFGRDVDGVRIGIARGVTKVLIGKVIGMRGASTARLSQAIQWAFDSGANLISLSLGIDFPGYQAYLQQAGYAPQPATSRALEGYLSTLRVFDSLSNIVESRGADAQQPCLLVAAAGNESRRDGAPAYEIAASPPAASRGFIAVAALGEGQDGLRVAAFSNTRVHVSGPGVDVVSAGLDGGLVSMDGTSMAAPHVAGVAALWAQRLEASRMFSSDQWAARVKASAVTAPLAPGFSMTTVGAGLVQAPQ